MSGARAGLAARLDLAAFGQETPQSAEILVVDLFDLVDAELADLAARGEFAAAAAAPPNSPGRRRGPGRAPPGPPDGRLMTTGVLPFCRADALQTRQNGKSSRSAASSVGGRRCWLLARVPGAASCSPAPSSDSPRWAAVGRAARRQPSVQTGLGLIVAVHVCRSFESAEDDDPRALGQSPSACLFRQALGQPAEDGDAIPVGRIHPFAGIRVTLAIVGCHAARYDHLAVGAVAHLWIDPEVANQSQLCDHCLWRPS